MKLSLAKSVLALGIAVLFAVFIGYGYTVVYERPTYLGNSKPNTCYAQYNCSEQCSKMAKTAEIGGQITSPSLCTQVQMSSPEYIACQKLQKECLGEWKKQGPMYAYSRNSFYILGIISLASIIAGALLISLEGIGSGFILGGVLLLVWTLVYTASYWMLLNRPAKVILLGIGLVVLVYFGYKRIDRRKDAIVSK